MLNRVHANRTPDSLRAAHAARVEPEENRAMEVAWPGLQAMEAMQAKRVQRVQRVQRAAMVEVLIPVLGLCRPTSRVILIAIRGAMLASIVLWQTMSSAVCRRV